MAVSPWPKLQSMSWASEYPLTLVRFAMYDGRVASVQQSSLETFMLHIWNECMNSQEQGFCSLMQYTLNLSHNPEDQNHQGLGHI